MYDDDDDESVLASDRSRAISPRDAGLG